MTDDLHALKAQLRAATPRPDPVRRAANQAQAKEIFATIQGSPRPARLTFGNGLNSLWTGAKLMLNTMTTKAALTATTAIVAAGFLFLTPIGQTNWTTAPLETLQQETNGVSPAVNQTVDDSVQMAPAADQAVLDIAVAEELPEVGAATSRLAAPAPLALQRDAAPVAGLIALPPAPGEGSAASATANTESYANAPQNPLKITLDEPVSTLSIDVDTASYAVVRSSLMRGQLPPPDALRVEEMINYFPYDYPAPTQTDMPFQSTVTVMDTPWNSGTQLVHIGLQGQMPAIAERPPLNLVFLIDTSGSMNDPAKLPLLRQSFMLMLGQLRPQDEIAIVAYAGSAGVVLAPTAAAETDKIIAALGRLEAGGSTNGQGGLEQAYATAATMQEDGDVSRVILATDGDFNVGISDPEGLDRFIAKKRDTGIYLSVLGFGRGNLDDATMQSLAQNGNGIASYIDTLSEAQKVLVDQLSGALFPIANDVKIQVEFNPAQVAEYRLIGYETRALNREDFNNDAVDAGELGAGHTVTAIYEVTPTGSPAQLSDPLRYAPAADGGSQSEELGFLKLRYKAPGATVSSLITTPITYGAPTSQDAQFAAAIAGFGQLLQGTSYLGAWSYADAIDLANAHKGQDDFGYRAEAVQLMRLAQSLSR